LIIKIGRKEGEEEKEKEGKRREGFSKNLYQES
jgi:hypothetical protein